MADGPTKKRVHPSTAARNDQAKRDVLLRRAAIAELLTAGITSSREIARRLGMSVRSIQRDLRAVEAEFRASIINVIEERRGLQIRQIDAAKNALWPKVQKGHIMAIQPYVSLLNRESKLLGLDAPIEIDLQWRTPLQSAGIDPGQVYAQVVALLVEQLRGDTPSPLLTVPELDVLDFAPIDEFGRRDDEIDDLDEGDTEDA